MKIPNLKGKALFDFLVKNKKALIAEKRRLPVKWADNFSFNPKLQFKTKSGALKDAVSADTEDPTDTNILRVEVVANTCLWMDSQSDVLLIDSAKRSIQNNKSLMVHIHDHQYSVEAKIGEVVDVELRMMKWRDLGVDIPGETQCIVFITDVMQDYNLKVFNQYKAGKIQQHSIGLCYIAGGIELAINDPDYEKEIDFWNKYIDLIGNKDEAEKQGYFWVVSEFKLLENSCVLFGSNILTPTLTANSGKSDTSTQIDDNESIDDDPEIEYCTTDFEIGALLNIFND